MDKDDYILKLERRIHNQRVALRENWMIMELRNKHRPSNTRRILLELALKYGRQIHSLRSLLTKNRIHFNWGEIEELSRKDK